MRLSVVLLHLLCLIVENLAMGYNCQLGVPENCLNNPRIGLSKNSMYYRLSLCSDSQCLPTNHEEWIECKEVCEMCRSILGSNSCTSNRECEQQVDSFLNSYCTSALASATTLRGPTSTVTVTQAALTVTGVETVTRTSQITVTNGETVTVTVSPGCSHTPSQCGQATGDTMGNSPHVSSQQRAEFALAALFGVSMILLVVVITGWVWTYSALKKKARENNKEGSEQISSFDVRKFFKNPNYEGADDPSPPPPCQRELEESLTQEQRNFQKVKYDRIVVVPPSQVENGRKYDILNRQPTFRGADPSQTSPPQCLQNENKVKGHNVTPVEYSYSQLGRQDIKLENIYCTTRLAK